SSFLNAVSSSSKALASFCLRFKSPNFRATFPECTSKGHERTDGETDFHIPKSTHALSLRQFHLSHIFSRFAAEPFNGSLTCFVVLFGCSISKNIFLNSEIAV